MKFQSKFVATALTIQLVGGLAQMQAMKTGPDELPVEPAATSTAAKPVEYKAPKNFAEDIGARMMGRPGRVPVADENAPSALQRQAELLSMFSDPMRAGFKFDARATAELKREGFTDIEIKGSSSDISNIVTCTNVAGFVYPTSLPHQGLGFTAVAPDFSKVEGTVCFGVAKKPLPVITKTLKGPMA